MSSANIAGLGYLEAILRASLNDSAYIKSLGGQIAHSDYRFSPHSATPPLDDHPGNENIEKENDVIPTSHTDGRSLKPRHRRKSSNQSVRIPVTSSPLPQSVDLIVTEGSRDNTLSVSSSLDVPRTERCGNAPETSEDHRGSPGGNSHIPPKLRHKMQSRDESSDTQLAPTPASETVTPPANAAPVHLYSSGASGRLDSNALFSSLSKTEASLSLSFYGDLIQQALNFTGNLGAIKEEVRHRGKITTDRQNTFGSVSPKVEEGETMSRIEPRQIDDNSSQTGRSRGFLDSILRGCIPQDYAKTEETPILSRSFPKADRNHSKNFKGAFEPRGIASPLVNSREGSPFSGHNSPGLNRRSPGASVSAQFRSLMKPKTAALTESENEEVSVLRSILNYDTGKATLRSTLDSPETLQWSGDEKTTSGNDATCSSDKPPKKRRRTVL